MQTVFGRTNQFKFTFILVFLPMLCVAQENLVPNPSFEEVESCPISFGDWRTLHWSNGNGLSPNNFNTCASQLALYSANVPNNHVGFQESFAGEGYVGISCFVLGYLNLREYVQTILTSSLTAGVRYQVGFYVNPANRMQYAISTMGAAITSEAPSLLTGVYPNTLLDAEPQVLHNGRFALTDTSSWVLISDTIMATGGEKYITIGNFHSDGESDTARFNSEQPPIGTSPTTGAYYYIDNVFVYAIDSVPNSVGSIEGDAQNFLLYPNPTKGELTIECAVAQGDIAMLEVFNLVGQVVLSQQLTNGEAHWVDVGGIAEGIYNVRMTIDSKVQYTHKLSVLK